jgi:hypothetical protein
VQERLYAFLHERKAEQARTSFHVSKISKNPAKVNPGFPVKITFVVVPFRGRTFSS